MDSRFGFEVTKQDRAMKFHTSRSQFLFVAFAFMLGGMPSIGISQNWQDPALQQPVRQYFSGDRYPLNEMTEAVTSAPIPKLPEAPSKNVDKINLIDLNPQSAASEKRSGFVPLVKREAADKDKTVGSNKPVVDNKTAGKKTARAETSRATRKSDNKSGKGKPKPKVHPHHPVKTWGIYRDQSPYPIDPRKPCSVCKRAVGKCNCGCQFSHRGIGNQGMPWKDVEPGGRGCGKKNCSDKRPQYSVYWPKPLSARRENRDGRCQGCGHTRCRCRKINDMFDHLVNFSLIDYQRKDNAYCGSGADPYGCLGESRSAVAGIGYRFPPEPVRR